MTAADTLRGGPVAAAIRAHRLIVVLRRVEPQGALLDLAGDLADAGARIFEITFDAPSAGEDLEALKGRLAARADGPFLVGAGTILRRNQLEAARRAGAEFAVAPLVDVSLVDTAVSEHLPFIPGAFTPSEVHTAWAAGATFVKLFPASAVGPAFVRELRGPFPDTQLIPTGGVDASNARQYLEAGAAAVGVGGGITRADAAGRRAIIEAVRA
ncbi:MAG TPA: bifunctional 4-hydroxy-2-oxoglutarate aldolase/2-dehydro-3-deoxy-phosphogluconate aldolase [Candidatus Limnocylindrales bacterium]|nr:bifunctional 4-hydroxy-2-oxoglutarate aldolase/2-dehydro-3-deoxy-phosphogluconate aldolase [Candidatus Limnocylindrales bacterium]